MADILRARKVKCPICGFMVKITGKWDSKIDKGSIRVWAENIECKQHWVWLNNLMADLEHRVDKGEFTIIRDKGFVF